MHYIVSNCKLSKKLRKLLHKKGYVRSGINEIHKSSNQSSIGLNICERNNSVKDNFAWLSIRVGAGLQAKRLASVNNSSSYFLCFIIIPFLLLVISRPRKYLKFPRSLSWMFDSRLVWFAQSPPYYFLSILYHPYVGFNSAKVQEGGWIDLLKLSRRNSV